MEHEVASEPCTSFSPDPDESALCFDCRWPVHFHANVGAEVSSPTNAVRKEMILVSFCLFFFFFFFFSFVY